ncbi:MAG: hypothetical protein ACI85O_000830, partial [Saprospiraceae bacterium]
LFDYIALGIVLLYYFVVSSLKNNTSLTFPDFIFDTH